MPARVNTSAALSPQTGSATSDRSITRGMPTPLTPARKPYQRKHCAECEPLARRYGRQGEYEAQRRYQFHALVRFVKPTFAFKVAV